MPDCQVWLRSSHHQLVVVLGFGKAILEIGEQQHHDCVLGVDAVMGRARVV
jgi:hypothetical protein